MAHVVKHGDRFTVIHGTGAAGSHDTEKGAAQQACDIDGLERTLADGKTKVHPGKGVEKKGEIAPQKKASKED